MPGVPSELSKLQFDYAWKWFAFHADQRTKMFNFMILVAGVLATAVATAYDKSRPEIAAVLSFVGAVAMLMFERLDHRNRNLIWLGEEVLTHLEREVIFGENLKIIDREEKKIPFGVLYRQKREDVESPETTKVARDFREGRHRFWNPAFAYLLSLLFLLLFFFVIFFPPIGTPVAVPSTSPVVVIPGPDAGFPPSVTAIEKLWPFYGVVGIALVAGTVLLIFGTGWIARIAGTVAIVAGLTMHGYVINKLQIGDLFRIEPKIDKIPLLNDLKAQISKIDEADIRNEIEVAFHRIGNLGPEYLGRFSGFDPGKSDLKENMEPLTSSVCKQWSDHIDRDQLGLLLVIGATDRVPLNPSARLRYESNFGLARARAEKVKLAIGNCGVLPNRVIALVSGPQSTPEAVTRSDVDSGFPEDRSVDVWAFWSLHTAR